MEILLYSILWLIGGILFATFLLSTNPYTRAKKLAKQAAEQIEILRHKWFESEKAGHDIGIEKANESWTKFHAKKWKASKK
tara:strand:- start:2248 stop:2490 length:243 start_codon:yes stop_codon:yes gene_type:complete